MNIYMVKSGKNIEYTFEANYYDIVDGIVSFYDEDGEVVWVIKEWISL